jgi:ribosomal protein L33
MASQKNLVFLQSKETGEIYHTRKNKKLVERKLKYKKFSRKLRKNVWFEEVKKPAKLKKSAPVKVAKKTAAPEKVESKKKEK